MVDLSNSSFLTAASGAADTGHFQRSSGQGTPQSLGFRAAAEWEPHGRSWLKVPALEQDTERTPEEWVSEFFGPMIEALIPGEEVFLLVGSSVARQAVEEWYARQALPADRIHICDWPSGRFEPGEPRWLFLVRQRHGQTEHALVYGACGMEPPGSIACEERRFPAAEYFHSWQAFNPGCVLDRNVLDPNGKGTLLASEAGLTRPDRNAGLSQRELTRVLRDYLGVSKILWLENGSDVTEPGPIDSLARFIRANTVVTTVEEDPDDPNYQPLQENWRQLRRHRDQDDRLLQVVKLPAPSAPEFHGQRFPARYTDFYIGNQVVLVPQFGVRRDARALEILQEEFPKKKAVGIPAGAWLKENGSLHELFLAEPK